MKLIYKFVDAIVSEVKVTDEIGQAITTLRREEEIYERKMKYHFPISIEQLEYQGFEFMGLNTSFSLYERVIKEEQQKALMIL